MIIVSAELAVIISLIVLLSRKQKELGKHNKRRYYSMQKAIDQQRAEARAFKNFIEQLKEEIAAKEDLIRLRGELQMEKENLELKKEFLLKVPVVERNLETLKKNTEILGRTNNIDVLQSTHRANLEIIRWLIDIDSSYMGPRPLFNYNAEELPDVFKEEYNNAVGRVAGHHYVKFRERFFELRTENARRTHTNRISILLDTLREGVEAEARNDGPTLEIIQGYYSGVEALHADLS